MAELPPIPSGWSSMPELPPIPRGWSTSGDEPNTAFQFFGGFNSGLARYTDTPERLLRMGSDLLQLKRTSWARSSAPLSDWLRTSVPAPQTPAGRVVRRVGEEFGVNAPYAGLAFAGAPAAAASGRSITNPNLAQRSAQAVVEGIASTPGRAAVGEAAAVTGAGVGAGVAREAFPGNETAEMAGQFAGGFSPAAAAYLPSGLAARGYNFAATRLSPAAQREAAKNVVREVVGPGLDVEAIKRAEALKERIPGYQPSLAEATGSPSLLATQRAIESRASGQDLENVAARRAGNESAVRAFADGAAPSGRGPEVIIDTATRQVTNLRERVSAATDATQAAREKLAAELPTTDKAEAGAALRENLLERRKVSKVRMAKLADDLGIGEADISVPFRALQDNVRKEISEAGAFIDRANVPPVVSDILAYGKRSPDSMKSMLRDVRYGSAGPQSLVSFLRSKGGLKDDGGELRARDARYKSGLVNNTKGRSLDDAALIATEAGYFPTSGTRASIDDLLAALDQELAGKPVYSEMDSAAVAKAQAIQGFQRELDRAGINLNLPDDEIVRRMEFENPGQGATVTFNDLMGLRSRITDDVRDTLSSATPSAKKLRLLESLRAKVDSFVESATVGADPTLAKRWAEFRQAYKSEYVDRFNQGAAFKVRHKDGRGFYQTSDERVADAFWRDVEGARQFKRTYGENSPEEGTLAGVILDDLRVAASRDGAINPQHHMAWLRRHGAALNEFPEINARVQSLASANEGLVLRAKELAGRERAIGRSLLVRELNAVQAGKPVEQTIKDAMASPRLMGSLSKRVKGTEAEGALARAVFGQVADAPLPEMRRFLTGNKTALQIALTPKHVQDLEAIMVASEQMARTSMPAGRGYDPNALADVEKRLGTGMNQISSRIFAAQSGRTSWRYIALDLLSRFWRGHSQQETSSLLNEALYNPQVARDVAEMLTVPGTRRESAKRLNTWLLQIGGEDDQE